MAVTLKDIAENLGISVTTVSRALAGYSDVSNETRRRVITLAEELDYEPNVIARRLKKRRTDTIGFIVPSTGPRFADPFFSEFIAGVGNEAASSNYDILLSTHAPDSDGEKAAYRRAVKGGWVDGLILIRTRVTDERIRFLHEHNYPFVAFGRTALDLDYPYVDEDGVKGISQLLNHLVSNGHQRVGFICPPDNLMFGKLRIEAFTQAMTRLGLDAPAEMIVEGNMTQRGGAIAAEMLLAANASPTAIIAGNDLMAIGVMNHMRERGLTPGHDIAVAGFDDIPLSAHTNPTLTTVRQPIYEIGRRVCHMLIEITNGHAPAQRQVLLEPRLIIRESTTQKGGGNSRKISEIGKNPSK